MFKNRRRVVRAKVIGPPLLLAYRAQLGARHVINDAKNVAAWLLTSREYTNYTYDLEPINEQYLAAVVSQVSARPDDEIRRYMRELKTDRELQHHMERLTRTHPDGFGADTKPRFGRRLAWYALARALKPKTIVETRVDKGLGACVLTAALRRNDAEGSRGRYYGTDINPDAGYLFAGKYAEYGEILIGDSVQSLTGFNRQIDILVNDSDHSPTYEAREYAAVRNLLTDAAVVVSDNADLSTALLTFASETERRFSYFLERPIHHWSSGNGIGIAYGRRGK